MKGRCWGSTRTCVLINRERTEKVATMIKVPAVIQTPSLSFLTDDPKVIRLAEFLARHDDRKVEKETSSDRRAEKSKYQLQLRMPETQFRQLEALAERAGAETVSEVIRMALRELERALLWHVTVVFEDGRRIPLNGVSAEASTLARATSSLDGVFQRVNVVLGKRSADRLRYIQAAAPGFTLGEIVEAAMAVLDDSLQEEEVLREEAEGVTSPQRPAHPRRNRS
ncbi:MAG: hypothetical protein IAE87_09480 [Rhodobacteraceae bacterium]|nr:hypothetical protein [Paracoccaceae bacterium]